MSSTRALSHRGLRRLVSSVLDECLSRDESAQAQQQQPHAPSEYCGKPPVAGRTGLRQARNSFDAQREPNEPIRTVMTSLATGPRQRGSVREVVLHPVNGLADGDDRQVNLWMTGALHSEVLSFTRHTMQTFLYRNPRSIQPIKKGVSNVARTAQRNY
jgi:hypothetical protein